jgi:hypothetical protein
MNKQTSILLSEAIGATVFSICAMVISYLYAKNCSLPEGFAGFMSLQLSHRQYIWIISILSALIGMLIGGIIRLREIREKSNNIQTIVLGLVFGICTIFLLRVCFALNESANFILIYAITFVSTLIIGVLCSMITSHSITYVSNLSISAFAEVALVLTTMVLPLTAFLIQSVMASFKNDINNNLLSNLTNSLFSGLFIILPMLVLWAILTAFSNPKKEN